MAEKEEKKSFMKIIKQKCEEAESWAVMVFVVCSILASSVPVAIITSAVVSVIRAMMANL